MKRLLVLCCALVLALTAAFPHAAHAADVPDVPSPEVCYPTSITQSEDGTEIRKAYDLSPDQSPAGIPRSDFEQGGFHYTLIDLLQQEMPEYQEREHTEQVSVESPKKDMESVLALLPQEREFVTEDGMSGALKLKLDTVQVAVAGYGSSTKNVSATRSYPNLSGQDVSYIPKTIQDSGRTLTLQSIDWQTDNTANVDGYAVGDRYTAIATYSGTATSSYVTGYVVTAEYAGTVSRIALDKVRYVAIFEGTPLEPAPDSSDGAEGENPGDQTGDGRAKGFPDGIHFNWAYVLVPLGAVAVIGGGIGAALLIKRKRENNDEEGEETE